jgi:hypothetical protein
MTRTVIKAQNYLIHTFINITQGLGIDWMLLVLNRDQWREPVNMIMNFQLP